MSTPRRSSRIKAKEEDKLSKSASLRSKRKVSGRQQLKRSRNVVLESSSEEEVWHEPMSEEEEEIDLSNLISPVTKNKRPNNFLKVHNSYNFDRGGIDTYEKDFIDDSHFQTPRKRHPKYKRKGKTKQVKGSEEEDDRHSSASSDDVGIQRIRHTSDSKRRVLNASSSDSEGDVPLISSHRGDQPKVNKVTLMKGKAQDTPTDSDEEINISVSSAKRRKKMVSLDSDSDEEHSEDSVRKRNGGISKRKRRLLKQPESDDEISMLEPSVRGSSGRAIKLQKEKERERQKKLRRLKASRGVKGAEEEDLSCSDSQASDDKDGETPDDYGINDQEIDPIMEEAAAEFSDVFTPAPSTAEMILFPMQDEGSSEEEESDWIVSSEDSGEEVEDMTTVLAQLKKPAQPIVYHFEAGCRETEQCIVEDDGEESDGLMELDTLLPLHEILQESGAKGWRGGEKEREEEGEGEGERGEEVAKENTHISAVARLKKLLPGMKNKLETVDSRGYTAVMVAADQGDSEALELLIEAGANINCRDTNLTTPLHLAALSGWVDCVDVLISCGHPVDCRDNQGWPPLLYAHFQHHHECVLALMKANPKQLSVLRDLLRRTQHEDPEIRRRTVKVVRSLLMSLAHHETYYSIFNEFVGQNPSVLDEDGFSFMKHCMALLSFDNKQAWLKAKLQKLREYAGLSEDQYSSGLCLHDLTRGQLLDTVQQRLSSMTPAQCWIRSPSVSFKGEPGICTGPRREFWACLCKELASGERRLFTQCDEGHLSLQPCSIFSKYFSSDLPRLVLEKHKQLLHSVGSLMACAVFHQDTLSLSLSKPLLKQLGGIRLNHPDDLQHVDQALHHAMTMQLEDVDISELELTFTQTLSCPWSGQKTVDVAIKEGGRACVVSQQNKDEYIKLVSQFKLEKAVEQELEAFLTGFWEVIPQKCLNVFSPDELSLLISGVPSIDVEDWSKNTQYQGLSPSNDIVIWFWKLVHSLKEEEKALLLKFATGSPRAPAGGFSTLQGLGGPTKFQVCSMPGLNKIPQASTCFNMLKLSDYSCEQELRNKILIAIRYGCEGFAFS